MGKNPVVHFEMPYQDAKRVCDFYEKAFGWQMANTGEEMGNYVTAWTAETDENRMVKTPGTINGGFYDVNMAPDTKEPSVVISVKNLEEAMNKVREAGGEILRDPQEIPGVGLWVSFKDSEGNMVSILQPKMR